MNLNKKTTAWVNQKIITQKQREAILATESGNVIFRWGVILLGIFCVGLGIISVVAANWGMISDAMKLAGAFAIFGGLLGGAYVGFVRQKEVMFEGFLFAAFLFCGPIIGLVGQIFHLEGGVQSASLLWAVAGVPLAIISNRKLIGMLWVPLALCGVPEAWWRSLYDLYDSYPLSNTLIFGMWLTGVATVLNFMRWPLAMAIQKWVYILLYVNIIIGDWLLSDRVSSVAGFALTVVFLTAAAVTNVRSGNVRVFKGNLFLMAVRLVILYFQVFISLAFTGVGLIISGGVILASVWGYSKISKRWATLIKGEKR